MILCRVVFGMIGYGLVVGCTWELSFMQFFGALLGCLLVAAASAYPTI